MSQLPGTGNSISFGQVYAFLLNTNAGAGSNIALRGTLGSYRNPSITTGAVSLSSSFGGLSETASFTNVPNNLIENQQYYITCTIVHCLNEPLMVETVAPSSGTDASGEIWLDTVYFTPNSNNYSINLYFTPAQDWVTESIEYFRFRVKKQAGEVLGTSSDISISANNAPFVDLSGVPGTVYEGQSYTITITTSNYQGQTIYPRVSSTPTTYTATSDASLSNSSFAVTQTSQNFTTTLTINSLDGVESSENIYLQIRLNADLSGLPTQTGAIAIPAPSYNLGMAGNTYIDSAIGSTGSNPSIAIDFFANGTWIADATRMGQQASGNWLYPTGTNFGSEYWIRWTVSNVITDGTGTSNTGNSAGWVQLNQQRSFSVAAGAGTSSKSADYYIEISTNSSGTNIVASGTVTLQADREL